MEDGKKRSGLPIILFIITVLVSAGIYSEVKLGLVSDAFSMSRRALVPGDITFEYSADAAPVFSWGKKGFLQATKDGAVYYSYKGETLWSVTYTMQRPYVIKRGESFVILEPSGRSAYVCGEKGLIYIASTEYPILNAGINSIDCLILLMSTDEGYSISILNGRGEVAAERIFDLDGIYPTCAALSDDGFTFSIGYVDTTKAALTSRILYFYTDSGAQRFQTDEQTPFKAIEKPGSVITKLIYGDNGNLTAVFDNEIFITNSRGEEVSAYKLPNRLESHSFGDEMFGIVFGQPFANASEKVNAGHAEWFDYNGRKISEHNSAEIVNIDICGKNILLKSSDNYILADIGGDEIWTFGAAEDIITIIPADKKKAVIARKGQARVYLYKIPKADGESAQ